MRDYSKASPSFWTGSTGKQLRALGRDAQVIGFYLFTAPGANMIGLYYLPLPTLCHEVGAITPEGALKVLRSLSEGGYAHYDEHSEHVWVVGMAQHQVGESLSRKDNRHKALVKLLEQYRKTPFFNDFLAKYGDVFELSAVEPNKELRRPLKAPSKPLRSQEQEQEKEQKKAEACAEPAAQASPPPPAIPPLALVGGSGISMPKPFIELPTNTGKPWAVYPEMVADWKALFPAVDVEQSLRSMRAWLNENRSNRKTESGMGRFVVRWLTKDQNSAKPGGNVPRGPDRGADTAWAWAMLREAIRDQRKPADPVVARVAAELGGLDRLGSMSTYDIDRQRTLFDTLVRRYTAGSVANG